MTALNNQWQELRQQRQQDLAERKQHVRETLAQFEQERQAMASQLRDDLSLFQLELQQSTQTFLANANKQRQAQAEQLATLLQSFVQSLQHQTSEFLAASAADRSLMAQQLFQDLTRFHSRLSTSVASLRRSLQVRMQELQAQVRVLQAETQGMLKATHEQRLQDQLRLALELAAFIEDLRNNVQTYMSELELMRQDRAQQLQNMLQEDRNRRNAEMDAMFQELAAFRTELRQYCSDLRAMVWGTQGILQPGAVNVQTAPVVQPKPAPKPAPKAVVKPIPRVVAKAAPQVAVKPAVVAAKPAIAIVPPPQPVPVVAPPAAPAPAEDVPTIDSFPVAQPIAPAVAVASVVEPPAFNSIDLEKNIYNHIHKVQGARLTEIESALDINRFQAVDALRSLIKKGLITQRDRIYLIQEEVSL